MYVISLSYDSRKLHKNKKEAEWVACYINQWKEITATAATVMVAKRKDEEEKLWY